MVACQKQHLYSAAYLLNTGELLSKQNVEVTTVFKS